METLYFNGDVVTMEGENDFAEAVLVTDGKIKAVGSYDAVTAQKSDACQMYDLEGKTLMPSFIDGHGHVSMAGPQYITRANLEDAKNFDDIIAILKEYIAARKIPAGQPVVGCLYDHNYLEEGVHPDKKVLDQVSTEHPIMISHASGHMGVVNSLALAMAHVDENTPEIPGGVIARYPGTKEPTGYLEETAIMVAAGALKGAIFAANIYERLGFAVVPNSTESRHDIIQAVTLGSPERVIAFCKGIQAAAPIDSYVDPEPWAMPGYDSDVIMAAGAFVQGSSIELSADGPIKPPYAVYFQGGLTWEHAKFGIMMSLQKLYEKGLVQLP